MSLSFLNHWMFPHYWVAPINLLYYLPLWKEKSSPTFLSSCHPISMLSYTWKILEKVIYTHCLHLVSYHSLLKPFLPQFFSPLPLQLLLSVISNYKSNCQFSDFVLFNLTTSDPLITSSFYSCFLLLLSKIPLSQFSSYLTDGLYISFLCWKLSLWPIDVIIPQT